MLDNFNQKTQKIILFFDRFSFIRKIIGLGTLFVSLIFGAFYFITKSNYAIYLTIIAVLTLIVMFLLWYIWENIFKLRKYQILDPNVRLLAKKFDYYVNFDGSYEYVETTEAIALIDRYQLHFERFTWTGDRSKTKIEVSGDIDQVVIDDSHSRYTYLVFRMNREYAKGEKFQLNHALTVYDSSDMKSDQYFSYRSDRCYCRNTIIRLHFPARFQGVAVEYMRYVGTTHGMALQTEFLPIELPSIRDGFYHVLIQVTDNRYIHKLNFENLEQLPAD